MIELQSQTKIVGTLGTNAVFFPSRVPLVPVKVVYRCSVTKPCTSTLRGQGEPQSPKNGHPTLIFGKYLFGRRFEI